MSKSSHSRHVYNDRREIIVDDEEIRGLVRGQNPTRVTGQQQQQQQRRQALHHRDQHRLQQVRENLEESESLFQENNTSREYDEEEETAETNRGNQRLNQSNHHFRNQERSRHSVRNSRFESLSTGATAGATQNNMSLALSDRHPGHAQSTASLLDSMERRTQRTYRYGIGLVCVGATLNWLGFAQGHGYVDPLRYLGVACVISGSFCVCLAMCRWLGRPISVSSHRVAGLGGLDYQDGRDGMRQNGDVHVINVAVPMYVPPMGEEYRPTKPPDYDAAVDGEPPPYDEAIKLSPGALFSASATTTTTTTTSSTMKNGDFFNCGQPSPSHSMNFHHHHAPSVLDGVTVVSPCRETSTPTMTNNNTSAFTVPSSNNSSISTTVLPEVHRTNFHPDAVVVVVDASESANTNSLTSKLGAPPPYTREYTPSPRRIVTEISNLNSNNNSCRHHDNSHEQMSVAATVNVAAVDSTATTIDNSNFVNHNNSNTNISSSSETVTNSTLSVSTVDNNVSTATNNMNPSDRHSTEV